MELFEEKPNDNLSNYVEKNIELKFSDISFFNYFENKITNYKNAVCLEYYITKYKQYGLLKKIDECAKGFYNIGVKDGDIATICLSNSIEGVVAFLALNKIGAIANFLHPASSENEIKDSLNETNSKILILNDFNYYKLKNIEENIKVKKIILVNLQKHLPLNTKIRYKIENKIKVDIRKEKLYTWWNDFIENSKTVHIDNYIVKGKKDDPAMILYSGGTTGTPKGVLLSNSNLISYIEINSKVLNFLNERDTILAIMPIFHTFGIVHSILLPLCMGIHVVLRTKFNIKEYCKLIKNYKPQILAGVPTLFESLLDDEKETAKLNLKSLKFVLIAGDILSPHLKNKINIFLEKHGANIGVTEAYGLTEAVAGVLQQTRVNPKDGTTGIPLPGINISIFSPTSEKVKIEEEGEICINGPTVMLGYFNNKKETNLVLKKHKDGKIWLHTGDLGIMDKDGFITYKNRLKRIIISSGYNIYPTRIEQLLEMHPAIKKCLVIGIPHKLKNEVPKAYIILNDDYKTDENLILEFKKICMKNLPKYSWPVEYEIKKELPLTKVGKFDYKNLK